MAVAVLADSVIPIASVVNDVVTTVAAVLAGPVITII